VPRPVSNVVLKALAPAPEARFQTALELQRAINKVMAECGLSADTSDVAAFAATHLAERTQKRRKAIELALKAAAERAAMNVELLSPASSKSSSGTAVPLGAITPAPVSTSDVLVISQPAQPQLTPVGVRSMAEEVAMYASGANPDAAGSGKKRGGFLRIALVAGALALVVGIALVATNLTRASGKGGTTEHGAASTVVANTATPTTPTPTPTPAPTPAPSPERPATTASETVTVDAGAPMTVSVTTRPRPTTGRTTPGHAAATATTTTTARPTQPNAPDFGY